MEYISNDVAITKICPFMSKGILNDSNESECVSINCQTYYCMAWENQPTYNNQGLTNSIGGHCLLIPSSE